MQKSVARRLEAQFEEAEMQGMCVTPACRADAQVLRRNAGNGRDMGCGERGESDSLIFPYVSPFPGLYLRRVYWSQLKRDELALHIMRTLSAMHSEWVFCSHSAALLHGLDVSWELLDNMHVGRQRGSWTRNAHGIVRHALSISSYETVRGVKAVSLREAILESLCALPFELSLGIVDSALHQRKATPEGLEAYFEVMGRGRKGIARARKILRYADGRAENGGESRARAVMIEEGYAPHELQVPFVDPLNPSRSMRGDLGWILEDGTICIGELDGVEKYTDQEMTNGRDTLDVLRDERLRESRMSAYGVRIMRFPFSYVLNRWELVYLMQVYGIPRSEIPDFC